MDDCSSDVVYILCENVLTCKLKFWGNEDLSMFSTYR